MLRALNRARTELSASTCPYQLFAVVHPHSSADDAIYVHTENPNKTEFPYTFSNAEPIDELPPFLVGHVDPKLYSVLKQRHGKELSFVIQPRA